MTFSVPLRTCLLAGLILLWTACGKAPSDATPATATPAGEVAATPPPDPTPAPAATPAKIEVPDLAAASTAKLAQTSAAALTQLTSLAGAADQPAMAADISALQTALAADDAPGALANLQQLAAYAKQVPGAEMLIESSKQMVSAWALKQGFDPAQITPVLRALQSRDYAALASQAAQLAGTGGLSAEQKTLLNGVLQTYGVDAKVDQAINKLKGLF